MYLLELNFYTISRPIQWSLAKCYKTLHNICLQRHLVSKQVLNDLEVMKQPADEYTKPADVIWQTPGRGHCLNIYPVLAKGVRPACPFIRHVPSGKIGV